MSIFQILVTVIGALLGIITSLVVFIFKKHVKSDERKFEQIEKELKEVVRFVDFDKHVTAVIEGFREIKNDFSNLREHVNKLINKAPKYYVTKDSCDNNKDTIKTLLYEFQRQWRAEKNHLEQSLENLNKKMDDLLLFLAEKNK